MITIVAFGNPLLDTIVNLENDEILIKYNLEKDGQIEVDEKCMKSILDDLSGLSKSISAGGCGQNTLRVLQWLLKKQLSAFIFGGVGQDNNAETLKKLVESDGVQTRYSTITDSSTGTTLSLINKSNRSLVANIGAAEQLTVDHLKLVADFHKLILQANIVYVEGFFLTKRQQISKYILDYSKKENKRLLFNLSGQYLVEAETEVVQYFSEHSDVLFGNKREYDSLYKAMELDSVDSLIEHLMNNYKVKYSSNKIIVITDASNDILCYQGSNKVEKVSVPKLDTSKIIDTTGAGDAFVSGFIAGLIMEKSLTVCAKIGCYSALNIIKQVGCTLPNFEPDINNLLSLK